MSQSTTLTLVGLLQWAAPIIACVWALRTDKSRAYIVLLSTGAAVFAGLFMIVPLSQMAARLGEDFVGVPYLLANVLLSSAVLGALVGVVGVIIQTLGKWRKRPA